MEMDENLTKMDESAQVPTMTIPKRYLVQVGGHYLHELVEKSPINITIYKILNATAKNGSSSPNSSVITSTFRKPSDGIGDFQISLCICIFFLAIIGNFLVILTLIQNRRMRTITNLFLLNLAISDMLLGVFCMPVTLIGTVLRNFIFGEFMCRFLPYMQGELLVKLFNNFERLRLLLYLYNFITSRIILFSYIFYIHMCL